MPDYTLTVNTSPSYGGAVTGAGIYADGATATVTATASANYTFTGWSGDCSGTGSCSVTMDADKSVTATFYPHLYLTTNEDDGLAIIHMVAEDTDGTKLTKSLFELSRTTDMTTHFDPAIHTREAIAAGITGHRALALLGSCERADLPTDLYFRDAWEWSD